MSGPCLIAFTNVRMEPAAAAAWIQSEPALSRHVQRTLWLRRGARPVQDDVAALAAALNAAGAVPEGVTGLRIIAAPSKLAGQLVVGAP